MNPLHFNSLLSRIISYPNKNLLATFGCRSVYIIHYDKELKILRHFLDEDTKENYICAEFYLEDNKIKLAISGASGIIKLLNINDCFIEGYMKEHGGIVTDLKMHPKRKEVIFSCSEDTTIRMWNISTKKCLAIFGGYVGHKDFIQTIDVSACGKKIVSGGTDCCIKVWEIPNDDVLQVIHFPVYSSSKIQKSYITTVKFYGLLIISKSVSNRISIICPETKTEIYNSLVNSDSFFISEFKETNFREKFDLKNGKMVIASKNKVVFLFDLNDIDEFMSCKTKSIGVVPKDVVLAGNNVFVLGEDNIIFKI